MQRKFDFLIFFLLLVLLFGKSNNVLACLGITDDLNNPNPTLTASFSLLPDVDPLTDCWTGAIRIRTDRISWRLTASRTGPNPTTATGNASDFVLASDLKITYTVQNFGSAPAGGAILVSPFTSTTPLSSIGSGTLVVSGVKKSGTSCTNTNTSFYKLTKNLCLYRDFVFNLGGYSGQISYLLVSP